MTVAKWGMHRGWGFVLVVSAGLTSLGCNRQNNDATETPAASTAVASAPAASSAPAIATARLPSGATPCGELGCLQFDSPEDAFRYVLQSKPAVLAVGEAHAQKGTEGIDSSAKRFTNTFLPFLNGKASDLVVELMAPNPSCKKKTAAVRKKHEVVTEQHAATNQNEYVQMGERAKKLGIVPDLLRPSCDDLSAISKAGDGAVATTLETIARLTTHQVDKLLAPDGRKPAEAGKMIVTYGGILHNDLKPSEVRAAWSFGPALSKKVEGRYVALDLFVPEYIEDTEVWRGLEWFAHYDRDKLGGKTTLFRLSDQSFALIFPRTES
jgi:hypothetical protein